MRALLPIFSLLLATWAAHADVTINSISGYSKLDRTQESRIIIYGGSAGPMLGGCTNPNANAPCNNCTGIEDPIRPCNERRIHPGLNLNFQFTAPNRSGYALLRTPGDSGTTIAISSVSQTNDFNLSLTWGTLCNAIGAGLDCLEFARQDLRIGVSEEGADQIDYGINLQVRVVPIDEATQTFHSNCDPDIGEEPSSYEGMCHFTVFPGDQQVHIIDPYGTTVLQGPNGVPYEAVRFYYAIGPENDPDSFRNANPANNQYQDLRVREITTGEFEFIDRRITGLRNGPTYYFRMANVDAAGNVFYFSDNNYLDPDLHSAVPDAVFGILDDELACFIATAAYGSPFASKVEDLRLFRDQVLLTHPVGSALVNQYYRLSPPVAQWVRQSEYRKKAARILLWPLWGVTRLGLWLKKNLLPQAQAFDEFDFHEEDTDDTDDLFSYESLPSDDALLEEELEPFDFEMPGFAEEEFEQLPEERSQRVESSAPTIRAPEAPAPPFGPRTKRIRHPGAAQGLVRIKRDGSYVYEVERRAESSSATSFYYGSMPVPTVRSQGGAVGFGDVYGNANLNAFLFDYERPFTSRFGKLGLKFGSGFIAASGRGRFENHTDLIPLETFNFIVIPTTLSVVYRLQWREWVAPRVEAGAGTFNIAEVRDDGDDFRFSYAPVTTMGAGLMISLTSWNRRSAYTLDSEYGIHNVWLDIGLRSIIGLNKSIDFTSHMITAGITLDY